MTFFTNFVYLLLLASLTQSSELEDNLREGIEDKNDVVVCLKRVQESAVPNEIIKTTYKCNVDYDDQSITFVRALNVGVRNKGGKIRVVSGGYGYKNVELEMVSQPGQPIDFSINIFANPSRYSTATTKKLFPN